MNRRGMLGVTFAAVGSRVLAAPVVEGFDKEDVALCDLLLMTEEWFGPKVNGWITPRDRVALKALRAKIAARIPRETFRV